MPSPRKISVISLLILSLLFCASLAMAAPAATVTHLSGPLAVRTASGATKALSIGSKIEAGDTVETARRTYARLKFTDGSEVTLKPNSRFKVEKYSYDQGKPKDDSGTFSLIKGGLRTVTGQIGKRGNQDSYRMKTPTATIGIRGTIYIAEYISPDEATEGTSAPVVLAFADAAVMTDATPFLVAAAGGPSSGGLAPGLYVQVLDGVIHLSNGGGTQNFVAGQFGFTPNFQQPPVILPSNPGIQFSPPPAFGSSFGGSGQGAGPSGGGTDCQVR